jgi:Flp pilus assembly pilin Flp
MIIKRIVAHLLEQSQRRQQRFFGRIDLIFWLVVLGLASAILITQPTPSAQAATTTTSQQAVVHRSASPTSPMAPKDVCDQQGNCNPDGTTYDQGSTPGNGNIKNPIADNSILFFTRPDLTVGQAGVTQLWVGGVAIVDVFIVLLITLNAVRIMMAGSAFRYADVAESLPRILVGVIAAHISLALIGILLGLNNGLCSAFLSWANTFNPNANLPNNGNISFTSVFTDAWTGFVNSLGFTSLFNPGGMITSLLIVLPRMILELVALTMSLMLFAQLLVRIMLIDLFTVISAPCLACWGLPGRSGQPVTNFWLQGALGAILAQVLQTVGIIVSQFIFNDLLNIVQQKEPGFFAFTDAVTGGPSLVQIVVYLASLWFILRLPSLFRLNPSAQMIMAGGQAAGGAVQGAASAATTAVTTAVGVGTAVVMIAK